MNRTTRHFSQVKLVSLTLFLTLITSISNVQASEDSSGTTVGTTIGTTIGTTLEDFYTAAIDYSPRLKIAEEQYKIGTARRDAATGQLKPQISAGAVITDNRRHTDNLLDEFDGKRYSIQLSQVLFDWGAFSAKRQASHIENQKEDEYYYELSYLLTEVAERYFNVPQAQGELDSNTAELAAVKNQLAQIQSLYDRQLARFTDLLQAKATLASVEADQVRLKNELNLAKEALHSATGLNVGELYTLKDNMVAPSLSKDIDTWVALAEKNNFQIKAKQEASDAADAAIDRSKGAFMPNASLILSRQDSDVGFDNARIQNSDTTYVGIDLRVPIYSGGSRRASLREAKSMRSIADNELKQVELDTSELVRSAYLQYKSSESAIKAARILVESTTASANAMQRGFELGSVTNVDVLNSIRDRFAAERRLKKAQYDSIKYYLLLKREAGSLTAKDMVEVSSWFSPAHETAISSWEDQDSSEHLSSWFNNSTLSPES